MVVIYDNKDFLNSFWANLVERHQNWLFKVRFGSYTNSNMLNSMMIFTFLCFETKIPFFGPKNQNCLLKMKFGTKTNSNLLNSMVMFAFSLLDRKYPFWAIKAKLFVQKETWHLDKSKYVEFDGDVHFFCFVPKMPFLGKYGPKKGKLFVWKETWCLD